MSRAFQSVQILQIHLCQSLNTPGQTSHSCRHTDDFAGIWPNMTRFLVSLYWTILADLGQQNSNNILVNTASLTTFSAPLGDASFARATTGKDLQIVPSTIFTSYLCQTARLKA